MKCNECGFENQEGSLFCSKCGTRLADTCPNCGKTVPSGSKFCNYCGQSLLPSSSVESITEKPVTHMWSTSSEAVSSKQKQSNSRIIISVICAISSVVVLIIGFSKQGSYYWHQEDLIGYFIGFMLFGIGALVAYKTELVTKAKTAGIILIVIGVLVFLFGVVCSGVYRHKFSFDNIEWNDIQINFYIGLIILTGGLFLSLLNHDKEQHSRSYIFSFRRVGSILVIGLSILFIVFIVLSLITAKSFDGTDFINILFYFALMYCGIRGFNCKTAKYGKIVMAVATVIFLCTIYGLYLYNRDVSARYKISYSGSIMIYCFMLLPAIFMCITPKHLKGKQDDGNVLYYCKKCDKFWEGNSYTSNTYCPECGEDTMKTNISAREYENMSDSEIEKCKKDCIDRWWDED